MGFRDDGGGDRKRKDDIMAKVQSICQFKFHVSAITKPKE